MVAYRYMPERPRDSRVIRDVQQFLGLTPGTEPIWEFQLVDEQVFPEEAPTRQQRERATTCLNHLAFLLQQDETCLNPQILTEVYERYRELIADIQANEHPANFTLTHLLGAARKHVAWFQEVKLFEETDFYDADIQVYGAIRTVLEQVLQDEQRGPGDASLP